MIGVRCLPRKFFLGVWGACIRLEASAIELELEQMEGRLSRGETIDLDGFTRAASHLRRLLESLGLERRARVVTPSLQEYLANRAVGPAEESVVARRWRLPLGALSFSLPALQRGAGVLRNINLVETLRQRRSPI
jgi:hypothetical protein